MFFFLSAGRFHETRVAIEYVWPCTSSYGSMGMWSCNSLLLSWHRLNIANAKTQLFACSGTWPAFYCLQPLCNMVFSTSPNAKWTWQISVRAISSVYIYRNHKCSKDKQNCYYNYKVHSFPRLYLLHAYCCSLLYFNQILLLHVYL